MATAADKEMNAAVEVLPGRVFWVALSGNPSPQTGKSFFCIDNDLIYWNFFLDFGPLNLGHLYRYCALLNSKLSDPKLKDRVVYHFCGNHPHKRANSAFLVAAWSMLYLNRTPDEAYRPFRNVHPPFTPWHDATPGTCSFNLTLLDTLRGLYKAVECGFFDFTKFNIEEYEHYEQVENGDLNWTLANKFIAFAGPHATKESHPGGYTSLCPDDYVPYFKRRNVKLVVRLNKKYYDARKFTQHGIDHLELYFLDGSNPPDHLLAIFLERAETTDGCIAVHCKAGLGRTGCMIGCYMMKHYRCTAEEVIGWLRIVRPGSIIGPQQQWLKEMQARMWRDGEVYRQKVGGGSKVGAVGSGGLSSRDGGGGGGSAEGTVRSSSGDAVDGLSSRLQGTSISLSDRRAAAVVALGNGSAGPGAGSSSSSGGSISTPRLTAEQQRIAIAEEENKSQGDQLRLRRMQAAQEVASSGSKKAVVNYNESSPVAKTAAPSESRTGRFFGSAFGK